MLRRSALRPAGLERAAGDLHEQLGGARDNSKTYISAGVLGAEFKKGLGAHRRIPCPCPPLEWRFGYSPSSAKGAF